LEPLPAGAGESRPRHGGQHRARGPGARPARWGAVHGADATRGLGGGGLTPGGVGARMSVNPSDSRVDRPWLGRPATRAPRSRSTDRVPIVRATSGTSQPTSPTQSAHFRTRAFGEARQESVYVQASEASP